MTPRSAREGWSTNKPTIGGWYWFRGVVGEDDPETTIAWVGNINGHLKAMWIDGASHRLSELSGEWAGPIEPPDAHPICRTCSGEGHIDSGGTTPWGAPIDIPCPSCKADAHPMAEGEEAASGETYREVVARELALDSGMSRRRFVAAEIIAALDKADLATTPPAQGAVLVDQVMRLEAKDGICAHWSNPVTSLFTIVEVAIGYKVGQQVRVRVTEEPG